MKPADVGLIGLAVMGQNLVLNMEERGYSVAVYNRTTSKMEEFLAQSGQGKAIAGHKSLQGFCVALQKPRRIFMMVKAGAAVDAVLEEIVPYLEPGDILVDAGNSFFRDTAKRQDALAKKGIFFVGMGSQAEKKGRAGGPV